MAADMPIATAIRGISRARQALHGVIRGSENFDYVRAKAALKELDAAIRELARDEAHLRDFPAAPDLGATVVPFPSPSARRP